jgi:predicted nucleotidyltransferase
VQKFARKPIGRAAACYPFREPARMNSVTNRERYLEHVKQIVLAAVADREAQIYPFGSFASRSERQSSDINVAIDAGESLPAGVMANLADELEESTVPFEVDLIDLSTVSGDFRNNFIQEGLPWRR